MWQPSVIILHYCPPSDRLRQQVVVRQL